MVFAAATLAMASGNSKEVADAIDQFQHSRGIKSLRVLRGDAMRQQFGNGAAESSQLDVLEQGVLKEGKAHFGVDDNGGSLAYRAIVPMIASRNSFGRNCMACHDVQEGHALGAVSLQIGLDQLRQSSRAFQRNVGAATLTLGALLLCGLYYSSTRTISRPLQEVISQLRDISQGEGD